MYGRLRIQPKSEVNNPSQWFSAVSHGMKHAVDEKYLRKHLQINVAAGWTTRLSDIAGLLGMSAIKVGQALDALHLRDRGIPTPEAASRGLGHRWFTGSQYLVEWHISGVAKVVAAYYDSIGNRSKASMTTAARRCSSALASANRAERLPSSTC